MKKLLLACLLFTGWIQAQNITFKDSEFKKILVDGNPNQWNWLKIQSGYVNNLDLNFDREIDQSEADQLIGLNLDDVSISPKIQDLDDINFFKNLKSLEISRFNIKDYNFLACSNLSNVNIFSKAINNVNINPGIDTLTLRSDTIQNIDFGIYKNLKKINLSGYNLYMKSKFINVKFDFSSSDLLETIEITGEGYDDLVLPLSLKYLYIYGPRKIKTFDLSKSNQLEEMILSQIEYNKFNFLNLQNIKKITLDSLTTDIIDLPNYLTLDYFYATNLDSIKSIDLSNIVIKQLIISRCNQLQLINIKNNNKSNSFNFYDLPLLKNICLDETEKDDVLTILVNNNIACEINSYCSFTPGGEYNTITNSLKFDSNGDCNGNDKYLSYTKFSIEDANGKGISVTDKQGIVQFYKQKGSYTLNTLLENPNYFLISPQSLNFSLNDNSGHDTIINFCVTPNGIHKDLEVILSPYGPARPGFDATYLITYKNKGNQTLSGDVSVQYNEDVLDFVRSTMSTQTSGLVSTSFVDLKPFGVKVDTLILNVNSPIETPAVNINDTLKFIATINPSNDDETPEDNVFTLNQRVVGAYDPNLITCLEGNVLKPKEIGKTLHYTIEFENTGNYPAENIVVVEEIDPTKYDINSIQILNTSHSMKLRIVGKKVEYYFENIDLGEHKHGNILLKLQGLKNLNEGDTVSKQANIYFDYNAPVQTNDEATVYRDLKASIAELTEDSSINVYPNPGKGNVFIEAAKKIKSLEVYDVNGRVIQSKLIHTSNTNTEINLSNEITGMYFIKVISEEGAKVIKYQKD